MEIEIVGESKIIGKKPSEVAKIIPSMNYKSVWQTKEVFNGFSLHDYLNELKSKNISMIIYHEWDTEKIIQEEQIKRKYIKKSKEEILRFIIIPLQGLKKHLLPRCLRISMIRAQGSLCGVMKQSPREL